MIRRLTIIIMALAWHFTYGQGLDSTAKKTCRIEIYLVEKGQMDTTKQCRYCFWPTVSDLADTAFIKDSEIIGYDITNDIHSLILSDNCLERLKDHNKPFNDFFRTAFSLVVDGEPIYGGWFLNTYVSNNHACDWIHIFVPFDRDGNGKIEINYHNTPYNYKDSRNNKLLRDCLINTSRFVEK